MEMTMRNMTDADRARVRESFIGNGLLFLFGCGVLAFLVAVDRVDVGRFIKLDKSVARMSVFVREIINGHLFVYLCISL
jgi:hypothetical protein